MNAADAKLLLCHIHRNTYRHTTHKNHTYPKITVPHLHRCFQKDAVLKFLIQPYYHSCMRKAEALNVQRAQIKTLTEKEIFFLRVCPLGEREIKMNN